MSTRESGQPIGAGDSPRYRGACRNFLLLDTSRPDIAHLLVAMLQAPQAVSRRSWSHLQQVAGEDWDEKGDRGPGTPVGCDHAPHMG
jgi:hypothetical protein